ncbi:MAG: hypothetical protein LBF68_01055, partial [Christensenellaceae bacterium]|nr:hypothetical protein [Christensenellaceae bacterium]
MMRAYKFHQRIIFFLLLFAIISISAICYLPMTIVTHGETEFDWKTLVITQYKDYNFLTAFEYFPNGKQEYYSPS